MKIYPILRGHKKNAAGLTPIYIRLRLAGYAGTELSTGIYIHPLQMRAGHIVNDDAGDLLLSSMITSLRRIYALSVDAGQRVTPAQVKERYLKGLSPVPCLSDIFAPWMEAKEKGITAGRRSRRNSPSSSGTLAGYACKIKNIKAWMKEKKMDRPVSEYSDRDIDGLLSWLEARGFSAPHVYKHLVLINMIFDFCIDQKYIDRSPTERIFYDDGPPKEIITLTIRHVNALLLYRFAAPVLSRVKDLFLFQCYTGVSYGDLAGFTEDDVIEHDGLLWIRDYRYKGAKKFTVPFLRQARTILRRYGGRIPVMTNQEYNRYLKQVAAIMGWDIRLTTHIGRKTFAHIMGEWGMTTRSIKGMLGHSSEKTTETHYLDSTLPQIAADIKRAGLQGLVCQAA